TMSAITLNIVYTKLPQKESDLSFVPNLNVSVIWSQEEIDNADIVIYFNGYSYNANMARKPRKARLLFITEPIVVHPPQYLRSFWKKFDAVLTWNPLLLKESKHFYYVPIINYGYPFFNAHGITGQPFNREQLVGRREAICQICGAKNSLLSNELYSLRSKLASWFHKHSSIPFDSFGHPPMNVPNYRGTIESKLKTFSQYRYALCTENSYDPRWTVGYVTEKIFDCFYASTLPIYYGCYDIEKYIPADCFIDYRNFNSPEELETFLKKLSEEDYLAYVDRIWKFMETHNPEERYHCNKLYEAALKATEEHTSNQEKNLNQSKELPKDFLESNKSTKDYFAFHISCIILACPFIFKILVRLSLAFNKIVYSCKQATKQNEGQN
ncbi:MAG: glycosyltransferase family 10, partial [Candidatus Theseobacter exili]|nr:glycosyltransferase family 10 [Candidatus Theseobacter exili]